MRSNPHLFRVPYCMPQEVIFVSEVLYYIPIYTNLSMTFIMLDSKGPLSLYVKGKSENPLLLENAGNAKVMPTIEMCGQLRFIMC